MVSSSRGTSRGPCERESGRVVASRSVSMSGTDAAPGRRFPRSQRTLGNAPAKPRGVRRPWGHVVPDPQGHRRRWTADACPCAARPGSGGTRNEANHASQPVADDPEAVARYYDALRAACPACTIVAGDVLDSGSYRRWLQRFLRASTTTPRLWGLHDYGDVTYGATTARVLGPTRRPRRRRRRARTTGADRPATARRPRGARRTRARRRRARRRPRRATTPRAPGARAPPSRELVTAGAVRGRRLAAPAPRGRGARRPRESSCCATSIGSSARRAVRTA